MEDSIKKPFPQPVGFLTNKGCGAWPSMNCWSNGRRERSLLWEIQPLTDFPRPCPIFFVVARSIVQDGRPVLIPNWRIFSKKIQDPFLGRKGAESRTFGETKSNYLRGRMTGEQGFYGGPGYGNKRQPPRRTILDAGGESPLRCEQGFYLGARFPSFDGSLELNEIFA
jgi:hypothetical protein